MLWPPSIRGLGILQTRTVAHNGMHYSWDKTGVHFVALGIVVGDALEVERKRPYLPMGGLPFLWKDLSEHVGTSGRPVVLVHHCSPRPSAISPLASVLTEHGPLSAGETSAIELTPSVTGRYLAAIPLPGSACRSSRSSKKHTRLPNR